jgi:hypothetical protein
VKSVYYFRVTDKQLPVMIEQLIAMPFLKLKKSNPLIVLSESLRQLNLVSQNALSVANTASEFTITLSEQYLIIRFFKTELRALAFQSTPEFTDLIILVSGNK